MASLLRIGYAIKLREKKKSIILLLLRRFVETNFYLKIIGIVFKICKFLEKMNLWFISTV